MTAPVTTAQVVLSKYLSSYTFYLLLWVPLLIHLKVFTWVTGSAPPVTTAEIIGSFSILILSGAFFTAIGILASALTSSQIIAAIISFGSLIFIIFMGLIPSIAGDSFQGAVVFHYVSVHEHLAYFSRGLIDFRPVCFYLSMSLLTLLVTHHIVDFRRWKY